MANEATLRVSLQIKKGNRTYQSQPTGFTADVTGSAGPTPGDISAPVAGVNVDLSQLTTPGLCHLRNVGDTYPCEVGVHDGSLFHPLMEILPGEGYVVRLSRNLGEEEDVPGTGTTGVVNALFVRGVGGTTRVLVEAHEK